MMNTTFRGTLLWDMAEKLGIQDNVQLEAHQQNRPASSTSKLERSHFRWFRNDLFPLGPLLLPCVFSYKWIKSPLPPRHFHPMDARAKERPPAPLDPAGNEVCLLFLKYGKCRYGKNCKKSHALPDKNNPFTNPAMQRVPAQSPAAREGPRIAFTVRKAPYPRPSQSGNTSSRPQPRRIAIAAQPASQHQKTAPEMPKEITAMEIDIECERPSISANPTTEIADTQMSSQRPKREPTPKRLPKIRSKCLLAPLFRTTVPLGTLSKHSTLIARPSTSREAQTRYSRTSAKSTSKPKRKSDLSLHQRTTQNSTAIPSNQISVDAEKIEQWYITNKAHLEPSTRKLVVLTKPTTVRQKSQLKAMRKHHWECELEVEGHLKRNRPTTYRLKISRSRIDWERLAPYITLMIQAAFEMDINHQHLPAVGTTLCALLEHKDLDALQCEEQLVSWGLTHLDARRFVSHLWDLMVAAAGESSIRGGRGIGLQVRQCEHRADFNTIQERLTVLNKPPA
ncbi:unnamed protein product [Mortierella alpina]